MQQHIEHHTAQCKIIGRVGQYALEGHVKGFFFSIVCVILDVLNHMHRRFNM